MKFFSLIAVMLFCSLCVGSISQAQYHEQPTFSFNCLQNCVFITGDGSSSAPVETFDLMIYKSYDSVTFVFSSFETEVETTVQIDADSDGNLYSSTREIIGQIHDDGEFTFNMDAMSCSNSLVRSSIKANPIHTQLDCSLFMPSTQSYQPIAGKMVQ